MILQIIYENKDLAAINKPAGVLFDWVFETRPDLITVHRLDKDTSGVILFAKNQETADYLKSLFQTHQIQKTYYALVVGFVKHKEGSIDLPIGRSKKTPLRRVATGEQRGKIREALTEYTVLERFEKFTPLENAPRLTAKSGSIQVRSLMSRVSSLTGFTLVEARPKTGRTHQIRSHFSAIGHPVVCDHLYSGRKFVCPMDLTRQFLHAKSIEFISPSGEKIKLEVDMPQDLKNVLNKLIPR